MLLQLSPILLFIGLIVSGRVTTIVAALLATIATLAVGCSSAPQLNRFIELLWFFAAGLWTALPVVLVIIAGLFFAECVGRKNTVNPNLQKDHCSLANTCLIFGPFMETVTGFGVGYAIALLSVKRLGIRDAEALALAAFSQYLVPWGALGIGTHLSAQIAGYPIEAIGWRCAIVTTLACCFTLPLFWRVSITAGLAPTRQDRREWILTLAGLMSLLIVANLIFPIEIAGMVALGSVLVIRHLIMHGVNSVTPTLLRSISPYISLIVILALMRLVPPLQGIFEYIVIQPLPEWPRFAPCMSPALPLLLISLIVTKQQGGVLAIREHGLTTLRKGWRTSVLTFLLIGMASMMIRAGMSGAVMDSAMSILGTASPMLLTSSGAIGGYLTGSNAGAGAMSMPLAAALTLPSSSMVWIVAATIFAGSAMVAISPVRFTMGQSLINASFLHSQAGLRMLIPFAVTAIVVATIVVFLVTS